MKIPNITIQQLLEAGVHLGHKTLRWNPKMKKYIFGKRDSIHIIDLTQTLELTKLALEKVFEVISNNAKILYRQKFSSELVYGKFVEFVERNYSQKNSLFVLLDL